MESISTAVVSGIQRHAQYAHVEEEAAQQHQTRLQKLCDNFGAEFGSAAAEYGPIRKKL